MSTWANVILDALVEIAVYSSIDPLLPEDETQGARRLGRIVDSWGAKNIFSWSQVFTLYNLTPNVSPNLIGPSLTTPSFATTPAASARPTDIPSISLVLNTQSPVVDLELTKRDKDWWHAQAVKPLKTDVPTDYYYAPDWPNGSIYFWPVPNFAYQARIETTSQLTALPADLTTAFSAPQGYELAVVLTLAEHSCTPYTRPVPPDLPARARAARAAVQGNNAPSPRTSSADYGTRGRRHRGGTFNYFSGGPGR